MDLTTSLRQHPVAALPALLVQGALLFVLAPPLWAFLVSEVLLLANQFWHHANVARRPAIARAIGYVFMTPEIHRVHHSATPRQTDSNFGLLFSFWDRSFGTYTPPETAWHFRIGLGSAEDEAAGNLVTQLLVPFRSRSGELRRSPAAGPATP